MQVFISLVIMAAFVGFLVYRYFKNRATRIEIETEDTLTPDDVVDKVDKEK